ncbi:hypothetical protein ACIGXM_03830 [Kitasatospora sp. NPDC052896]|uniref:hypothetical protein n=1 Tax=Kitasatospora sp. NPDC052896 TaxID=3364061 RepID=UPI0037CAB2B0
MRRSLALAAVTTLASSVVLTGAQGALAVTGTSPSAKPSNARHVAPTAAPSLSADATPGPDASPTAADAGTPVTAEPTLKVQGLARQVTAGGGATEFSVSLTNQTGSDLVFYPTVGLATRDGQLDLSTLSLDYRYRKGGWRPATISPNDSELLVLDSLDDSGEPAGSGLQFVPAGQSITIQLRLKLPADARTGPAAASFVAYWAPVDAQKQPTQAGELTSSRPDFFCILPPHKPHPHPTGTPTGTGKPSPSPSASTSAPASPSPTVTGSTGPTGPASPSPTQSDSTPPSASPSASGSTSGAPTTTAPGTPAPSSSSSTDQPVPFPVTPPKSTPLPIASGAVQSAKAAAPGNDQQSLAFTGGGGDAMPLTIGGAAALVIGAGTLVALRRRRAGDHA